LTPYWAFFFLDVPSPFVFLPPLPPNSVVLFDPHILIATFKTLVVSTHNFLSRLRFACLSPFGDSFPPFACPDTVPRPFGLLCRFSSPYNPLSRLDSSPPFFFFSFPFFQSCSGNVFLRSLCFLCGFVPFSVHIDLYRAGSPRASPDFLTYTPPPLQSCISCPHLYVSVFPLPSDPIKVSFFRND